jgi:hypothetical protein
MYLYGDYFDMAVADSMEKGLNVKAALQAQNSRRSSNRQTEKKGA